MNGPEGSAVRRQVHQALCLCFVAGVALAYPLAAAAGRTAGEGLLAARQVGLLTIVQYAVLTGLMLGAWTTSPQANRIRSHGWTLAAGLAARLLLVPVPSYTSNDAERYLWDGRVALAGLDPYVVSPDAPEVAGLRREWSTPPEHARYPTLYPPGALATFALVAGAGSIHAPIVWKLATGLAGIAILGLAIPLLARAGRLRNLPLIALSPILVLETGVGAHVDAFAALSVIAALLATQRSRPALAGVLLGVGGLYKLLPAVAILPLGIALGVRRGGVRLAAAGCLTVAAGYLGALVAGLRPVGSLQLFFERWHFGAPLSSGLEAVLDGSILAATIGVLLAAGLVVAALLARQGMTAALQVALATPLIVSPVVFPWYLCALVPVTALAPSAFMLAWLSALPLTYEVLGGFLSQRSWEPATWPLVATAAACTAGGLLDVVRLRRRRTGLSLRVDHHVHGSSSSTWRARCP